MPTPVSAARQCLTEEAARALDDAVSVARRRCHAQTTSLHAVSALLSLPSSALRDACSRARSCAYLPRLQFRALDLSVGVSLDRLPSSKPTDEPPVSNSLMAAIKRSQANQRRHPESFHLHQIHNQQQTPSILKVELKYFILSILDDPIVSRVFGEAGFRSCDVKLAIMHPPLTHHPSRFSRSARCPPIFLCNLTDSDLGHRNFPFPFSGGYGNGDDDSNSRRIAEILVRKTGRNPLLIGVYAADALQSFTDCVQRYKSEILPVEISGLRVICIEKEISEFVSGNGSKEKMRLKFEEVFGMIQKCSGPSMVVNYGDLSVFLTEVEEKEEEEDNGMSFVVSQLTDLLKLYNGKVWLIGAIGTYKMHEKFLAKFPAIEKDWDLHLLPITSKPMVDMFGAKSSLMGSFVPFGGFFPSQSNFPSQLSNPNQLFTRCHQCTEKYEQEVAAIWKPGSSTIFGCHSESSLHMPVTELDAKCKEFDVHKTRDDGSALSDKITGLQKKWNDICRLHQRQMFPKLDISHTRHGVSFESTRFALDHERSGEEPSSVTAERFVIGNPCLSRDLQNNLNTKQARQTSEISDSHTDNFQSNIVIGPSPGDDESLCIFSKSVVPKGHLHSDNPLPSSLISVTTDLGLGTLYASASENKRKVADLESKKVHIQHLTGSNPTEYSRPSNNSPGQSPGFSDQNAGRGLDMREFKSLWNALNEKVSWQGKATSSIVETILRCRTGGGRRRSSNSRGDIWLTFLGPDMMGKRKISLALAELMFGSRENLISVDFGSQDRDRRSNSLFDCQGLNGYDERFRGQTVVDYVAGELRKKPSSVVLLENVDKADVRAKSCLSQAITTGKFPDSHGRQFTINNTIFVTTLMNKTVKKISNLDGDEQTEFSEERILAARNYQMQILVQGFASDVSKCNDTNVRIMCAPRGSSNLSLLKRRKLDDESTELKKASSSSMSLLDLNLPLEEVEDGSNDGDCDSDSVSEGSEAWLDEFLEEVDEKVMFKPYDFDEAAEKLVKEINLQFRRVFGSEVILEIDYKIIVQIIAANWVSEKKRAMEEWLELVLHRSFVEAEHKYQMGTGSVMKLVCKEDCVVEGQAAGILLPAKIKLI
ncbi:protein SMAX1-LIKE 6 [Benincasa hispida]|uniref:protein SMAX1-LIKE 6 n=1 Tax=Benincasa hispida TaxID=102211 RepID=UPI0018FF6425|nr:protein SMAX1-LIKE 6 [Benincasa hispida]